MPGEKDRTDEAPEPTEDLGLPTPPSPGRVPPPHLPPPPEDDLRCGLFHTEILVQTCPFFPIWEEPLSGVPVHNFCLTPRFIKHVRSGVVFLCFSLPTSPRFPLPSPNIYIF